jgi:hypothetical protein
MNNAPIDAHLVGRQVGFVHRKPSRSSLAAIINTLICNVSAELLVSVTDDSSLMDRIGT